MKKDAWFFINMVLNAIAIMAFMILLFMCLIFATGCTHTKKTTDTSKLQVEQGSNTKIEYRTNTIYTDTGSQTTYYRDSVIFSHDTVIQPIDKIVNRWYRQAIIHDTLIQLQHDTTTVTKVNTVTVKEKSSITIWFWFIVAICLFVLALLYFPFGKK